MMPGDDDEEFLRMIAYGAISPPVQQVQPLPETIKVEDDEVDARLNTRGRQREVANVENRPPPVNKRGRAADAGEDRAPKKKKKDKSKDKSKSSSQRSGPSGRYRSFALDEEFVKKSYEEYVSDPMAAFIHTTTHLQDIANEEKRTLDLRVKELEDKLSSSKKALLLIKNDLKMTTATLASQKSTEKVLEEERARLASERDAARQQVKELEERVEELKNAEQSLTAKVSDLEETIKNQQESSEAQGRIAELEKALKVAEANNQKIARAALGMKEKGFNLALEQVKIVNPSMDSMRSVLNSKYVVEEGKIIKVDPATKAKSVIYPLS